MQKAPQHEAAAPDAAAPSLPTESRQFDFWLGEWDVSWNGGAGTNSVTRILDGQVIQERFTAFAASPDDKPFIGMSVSVFDLASGKWRQTWVDNSGSYMDFTGAYVDGKLTLYTERTVDGKPGAYRMVFYNIAESSLDWDWERSEDGGQTWTLLWRIHYQRRVTNPEPSA